MVEWLLHTSTALLVLLVVLVALVLLVARVLWAVDFIAYHAAHCQMTLMVCFQSCVAPRHRPVGQHWRAMVAGTENNKKNNNLKLQKKKKKKKKKKNGLEL